MASATPLWNSREGYRCCYVPLREHISGNGCFDRLMCNAYTMSSTRLPHRHPRHFNSTTVIRAHTSFTASFGRNLISENVTSARPECCCRGESEMCAEFGFLCHNGLPIGGVIVPSSKPNTGKTRKLLAGQLCGTGAFATMSMAYCAVVSHLSWIRPLRSRMLSFKSPVEVAGMVGM